MTAIDIPPDSEEASYRPLNQFILFGDSITQFSCSQQLGFGLFGALQDGKYTIPSLLSFDMNAKMLSLDSVYSQVRCDKSGFFVWIDP